MMTEAEFLLAVREYIEATEVAVDCEYGNCRLLEELIKDDCMPQLYEEVLRRQGVNTPTPRPWAIEESSVGLLLKRPGCKQPTLQIEPPEDALLIVEAVNGYESLNEKATRLSSAMHRILTVTKDGEMAPSVARERIASIARYALDGGKP